MKIGIIGAGNVGTGIGTRLSMAGHDVMIGFARSPEKVAEAAAIVKGHGGSPKDVVTHGDVIILATPWAVTLDAVNELADSLLGKILWDTTNPLKPDMSGLAVGTTTSAGEMVASAAPGARTVKAIVPFAEVLHSESMMINGTAPGVFVCGDDAGARLTVSQLVDDIGADPTDAGPLALARYTEPLGMLLVQLAYVQGFGPRIGAAFVKG